MRTKRILLVFTVILLAVCTGLCLCSNFMVSLSIRRGSGGSASVHKTLAVSEDAQQREREARADALMVRLSSEAEEWYASACTETYQIRAEDGIHMKGYFFMQQGALATHNWAVIVHGYNGSARDFLSYAKAYYEHGWNVFMPDLRASGESEGTYIGMGWLDRRDIILWLNEIVRRDSSAQIVLHGFSMGAATVMMASGEADFPDAVKVCVEDAGYSSDWAELEDKLHKIYHLPSFPLLHLASIATKIRAGYSIKEADCVPQLRKNKTPMLFIHGDRDDYNPFYMLDIVYDADACDQKEKLVVSGARHVRSAYTEPELYWNTVWSFIARYVSAD